MLRILKILFFLIFIFSVDGFAQQNKLQHFSISEGLSTKVINSITQDHVGYLWLATQKGLIRFDGNTFKNYNAHSTKEARSVFAKKDTLYIGHKNGFYVYNQNTFKKLGQEQVTKIITIQNTIYLGTEQGIYQIKDDFLQPLQIHTKIDFSPIKDILYFKNNTYIATKNALWLVDKLKNPTQKTLIFKDDIIQISIINNQIIVATKNNGIKIIEQNKVTQTIQSSQNCTSIQQINDEIWITTKENGIEILDAYRFSFKRKINKYNTDISNKINTVFKDKQNNVWIATKNKALYKYKPNLKSKILKPTISLTNFTVNYKNSLLKEDLKLSHKENNIAFSFKTVDLNHANKIQYSYQLNNNKSSWSTTSTVNFASLKPGKYRFSVQSKIDDILSDKKTINFYIDTPLYKKPWFLILSIALIAFLGAVSIEMRIQNIKKKNKTIVKQLKLDNHLLVLEQKALQLQMNPHFIFNVLNGIKSLGNSHKTEALNKTISHFSLLLRNLLHSSRLEEITLKQEIETINSYLSLEQGMSSKIFDFKINTSLINIDADEILIPSMIIQPFVENCVKHGIQPNSENGLIQIDFFIKNNFLQCTILDNGIGFNHAKDKKHKKESLSVAMNITKERIQNLTPYNSFKVEEIKEETIVKGTKVFFKIPLKTDF